MIGSKSTWKFNWLYFCFWTNFRLFFGRVFFTLSTSSRSVVLVRSRYQSLALAFANHLSPILLLTSPIIYILSWSGNWVQKMVIDEWCYVCHHHHPVMFSMKWQKYTLRSYESFSTYGKKNNETSTKTRGVQKRSENIKSM